MASGVALLLACNGAQTEPRQNESAREPPPTLSAPTRPEQKSQAAPNTAQEQAEKEKGKAPAGAEAKANEKPKEPPREALLAPRQREAEATFTSAPGVELKGEAKLEELGHGVKIDVEVDDAPAGPKGIHVHEKGDCSDIVGKSMGEHFAPKGKQHGLPNAKEHHLGDLGNITIAQNGKGKLEITVPDANLKPDDQLSLLGKAIVIHQGRDSGHGQSGNAGDPIGCAVIRPE